MESASRLFVMSPGLRHAQVDKESALESALESVVESVDGESDWVPAWSRWWSRWIFATSLGVQDVPVAGFTNPTASPLAPKITSSLDVVVVPSAFSVSDFFVPSYFSAHVVQTLLILRGGSTRTFAPTS